MEQLTIDMIPTGAKSVGHASQFDIGRIIRFNIVNKGEPVTLTGAETIKLHITKPDGTKLEKNIANTSSTYVDWVSSEGDYDQTGVYSCELKITNNTQDIGSKNFIVKVEEDPYSEGGIVTETASGDPAVFNTNMVELFIEIKCNINAVQNGTPWIDSNIVNKEPYLFRKIAGTASRIGNSEFNKIVGGTVAFNQLADNTSATVTAGGNQNINFNSTKYGIISGHKYLISCRQNTTLTSIDRNTFVVRDDDNSQNYYQNATSNFHLLAGTYYWLYNSTFTSGGFFRLWSNTPSEDVTYNNFQVFDLTAMFGSTIADYIYNLETQTAGAGVAWFKALFPNDYYPYNAGQFLSVKAIQHNTIGFNQWDEDWEVGYISVSDGQNSPSSVNIRSKNYIPVLPNTNYYLKSSVGIVYCPIIFYDANKNFVSSVAQTIWNRVITTPSNAIYMRFYMNDTYGTTYKHDICINISDANRNGTYEPYSKHEYNLDSDLELRGIPKLDGSNNLYYDGDTYSSSGEVVRKYGIVDLGSLSWGESQSGVSGVNEFYTGDVASLIKIPSSNSVKANIICDNYVTSSADNTYNGQIGISVRIDGALMCDNTTDYPDAAAFKTAMSGVYLVYELATPTTETADPFTNPMVVDGNGTEEFVDGRAVEIPVGHESFYADIYQISGHTELNLFKRGINQWDEEWEVGSLDFNNGSKTTANTNIRSKNYIRVVANTSCKLICPKNIYLFEYDGAFNFIRYNTSSNVTLTSNTAYALFVVSSEYGTTYNNDISINYPSTETAYHAYEGELVTVAFGQTVYDAIFDVTTGKLKLITKGIDLGSLNWTSTAGIFYTDDITDKKIYSTAYMEALRVDIYMPVINNTSVSNMPDMSIKGQISDKRVYIKNTSYKSSAAFKSAMSGKYLVYELATPVEVQLTARQLETILGENIISHDCNGTTDVKYLYEA